MTNNFRGMSGAIRQAAIDSGLDKKIRVDHSIIYNDKQTSTKYSRRFNWDLLFVKRGNEITELELNRFSSAVSKTLEPFGVDVVRVSATKGNLYVYTIEKPTDQVKVLRQQANALGYDLVKI